MDTFRLGTLTNWIISTHRAMPRAGQMGRQRKGVSLKSADSLETRWQINSAGCCRGC